MVEILELITKVVKRQNRYNAEWKLNKRSCCVRLETNKNINPVRKTVKNTGWNKKEEKVNNNIPKPKYGMTTMG